MAIYAIGDIQGCYDDLLALLDKIAFNPRRDRLWFTGDLVNRGPHSLATLRFVKGLGNAAVTVLGNHDLHLLAVACGQQKLRKKDSLAPILDAPDRDELLDWLRRRPLLHTNDDFCLVHAGLPPQWNFTTAKDMALKVERVLQSDDYREFIKQMYGNQPDLWSPQLTGVELLRFIVNCFTRMRYCDADGRLDFENNGPVGTQAKHLQPWFTLPDRRTASLKIVFGHWSTLGFYAANNCYAVDTGCLWGGQLTALKLGPRPTRISIDCPCHRQPAEK